MHAAVASPPTLLPAQAEWVRQLEATFAQIARTRMAGLPVVHPRLRVQAVGFHARSVWVGGAADEPRAIEAGALGVLVTPWFMNLVWRADVAEATPLPVGQTRVRTLAGEAMPFLGAFEPAIGAFEACSLISPMFQFADHAAAVATATAVLQALRDVPMATTRSPDEPYSAASAQRTPTPAAPTAPTQAVPAVALLPGAPDEAARVAARRGFLFGRAGRSSPPSTGSSR
ncbi:[NiFe]-hydrogenase assembly chaperone HybE [uncultured Aquabacterium sp.]|jgi:[NiFe] hydrogenase assembly HybE family chaperone|uniref:[NiFe]-hydrogenase assembly chaperone HybE n=1 Tax=uncultured Aquabacterium sp. TaxID=158753 RepID=UPI002618A3AA|nr:[NiFe]-hydrogenase assembly chaperone HybE [uncultured Aquabacterium sp.]